MLYLIMIIKKGSKEIGAYDLVEKIFLGHLVCFFAWLNNKDLKSQNIKQD